MDIIVGFMSDLKINYKTKIEQRRFGDKLFVLEVIRDLDEAIDHICDQMSDNQKLDPFAEDLCPYFGVLWPASVGLTQFLFKNSHLVKRKKILEIGCGAGLPSLASSYLGGDVLATDFHPDVEVFFIRNCRHSNVDCSYERMNWREESRYQGEFDLVIGSDILYESKHPDEVAKALARFIKPEGKIILSDPERPYANMFLMASSEIGLSHEKHMIDVNGKSVLIYELSNIIKTDGHTHNG